MGADIMQWHHMTRRIWLVHIGKIPVIYLWDKLITADCKERISTMASVTGNSCMNFCIYAARCQCRSRACTGLRNMNIKNVGLRSCIFDAVIQIIKLKLYTMLMSEVSGWETAGYLILASSLLCLSRSRHRNPHKHVTVGESRWLMGYQWGATKAGVMAKEI